MKWFKGCIRDGELWPLVLPKGTNVLIAIRTEPFRNPSIGPVWWVMKTTGLWQVAQSVAGSRCQHAVQNLGAFHDQDHANALFSTLYAQHCRRAMGVQKQAKTTPKWTNFRI